MWRNQNSRFRNHSNQTLDYFLKGIQASQTNNDNCPSKSITPRIKVPASSGLQATVKPILGPFLYPCYPEFRQYQYTISIKCVTQNTLVCLPTGLGKTHIASVLITNFHIWFPNQLIFFLAPTKPLVDQQSMSLSNFNHLVPKSCIFSLTGSIQVPKRVQVYKKKKILFCTPQTLENDLRQERVDKKKIVLIIFDEAHKAVGNYAYTNIIRILDKEQFGYRVIGLSATPGSDYQRIQQVIQNLQIANMVVKTEDDSDVKKYIKNRKIQPIFIQFTDIIKEVDQILNEFIRWPLSQLLRFNLFDKNLSSGKYGFNANCFYLIKQQINERLPHLPIKYVNIAYQALTFLKFVIDSQSILRYAGYESFKRKFIYQIQGGIQSHDNNQFMDMAQKEQKLHKNYIKVLKQHPSYIRIKQLLNTTSNQISHPKLQKLRNLLYTFFTQQENIQKQSKVIVFAHLRYTCHEIKKYLSQPPYSQVIKSQIFLGQSKTTIQTRQGETTTTQTLKLSQKQQINLIKKYKSHEINTLISTSIGQQGLDIGQVDAIFCYQGGMSTIRMVQRMGRTGRKRDGIVYMLLMQGKETEDYEKIVKKNQKIKKIQFHKYKYYCYNPVLFQEYTEIPIQFFHLPENVSAISSQQPSMSAEKGEKSQQTDEKGVKKQKNTKKRTQHRKIIKNKSDKDGRKTKKKRKNSNKQQQNNENISEIQQASKSQQLQQNTINNSIDASTSKNNVNRIIQKYLTQNTTTMDQISCESINKMQQHKFFKIVGNKHINANIIIHDVDSPSQKQQEIQENQVVSNLQQQHYQLQQQQQQQQQWELSQLQDKIDPNFLQQSKQQVKDVLSINSSIGGQENNGEVKQLDKLFNLDQLLSSDTDQQLQLQEQLWQRDNYLGNSARNKQSINGNFKYGWQKNQLYNCPKFGQSGNSSLQNISNKCQSCQSYSEQLQINNKQINSGSLKKSIQNLSNSRNSDAKMEEISSQISEQTKRIISLTKYMRETNQKDDNIKHILENIRKEEEQRRQKQIQKKNRKQLKSRSLIQIQIQNKNENNKIQKQSQQLKIISNSQQNKLLQRKDKHVPTSYFQLQQQQYDEFQQLFQQHNKITMGSIKSQPQQFSQEKYSDINFEHENKENSNSYDEESDNLSQLFKQHQIIFNQKQKLDEEKK